MPSPAPATNENLRYLKGIGPKRAQALNKIGIHSVKDLLYFFPRRYEDRSQFSNISQVQPEQTISLNAEILKLQIRQLPRMRIFEMLVGDATGTLHAVWFNQPYLKNQFQTGQRVILYGKIERYQNRLQMNSPEYEVWDSSEEAVHTSRITPVYPLTEGLFQRSTRNLIKETLDSYLVSTIHEYLPEAFRQKRKLLDLRTAVREMHFPVSFESQALARQRIVYDEFLIFEIILLQRMQSIKSKHRAHALKISEEMVTVFKKNLPFEWTAGQEHAVRDLVNDFSQSTPSNRLLQGDVGSGKTVVAAFAFYAAIQNQLQAVMLVPTEILAEQHYRTLLELLKSLSVPIELLTASTTQAKRGKILSTVHSAKPLVLVGTHAILSEEIRFTNLALVVIDEQHKFGVHQRNYLLKQNPRPHQLVMTATPIPRTLALTTFGDLDVSVMNELPQGRKPIKTYWINRQKQPEVLEHIRQKAAAGEQAYFIFPLIEETEKIDLLAAKRECERLQKTVFKHLKLGLIHGKLSADQRNAVMRSFNRGETHIVVSTSVIEVGVDNPNATIMVIENAERFGLSQLHQMRGRIGRGSKSSECFLFGEPKTPEGQKRLRILTKTQDGFVIAEEDLKLRGPGDFLGTRQSGVPLFRYANPIEDYPLLIEARQTALNFIRGKEFDSAPEWQLLRDAVQQVRIQY